MQELLAHSKIVIN